MTGSRGPVSKADGKRLRRNKRSPLVLEGKGLNPDPPKGSAFLTVTVQQWETFWASDIGQVMREEHMPLIERLFFRYDERERAARLVRKKRLAKGSAGQPVLNPLWKLIDAHDSEIRQLEDRIGLSPRSRIQIGGAAARAQASLDEMNADLEGDDETELDEANRVDPRVAGSIR